MAGLQIDNSGCTLNADTPKAGETNVARRSAASVSTLPVRLKELRTELGWTLEDVAQRVGVTQRAVTSNWEATNHRRRTPDLATLLELQRWYGVSLDYLIGHPNAERDGPAVKEGKKLLRQALRQHQGSERLLPKDRAQVAWTQAETLAPEAFFRERLAAYLMMQNEDLQEVVENAFWSSRLIERLGEFLGLSQEWFYASDPAKVKEAIE